MSQKKVYIKLAVPEADAATLKWLSQQDNVSVSIRSLIHKYVSTCGYADPTCEDVEAPAGTPQMPAGSSYGHFEKDDSDETRDEEADDANPRPVKPKKIKPKTEKTTLHINKRYLRFLESRVSFCTPSEMKDCFNHEYDAHWTTDKVKQVLKEYGIKKHKLSEWTARERRAFNRMHKDEIFSFFDENDGLTLTQMINSFNNTFSTGYKVNDLHAMYYAWKKASVEKLSQSVFGKSPEDVTWEEDGQKFLDKLKKDASNAEKVITAKAPAYA